MFFLDNLFYRAVGFGQLKVKDFGSLQRLFAAETCFLLCRLVLRPSGEGVRFLSLGAGEIGDLEVEIAPGIRTIVLAGDLVAF